jgi:sugar/nucleoside kinase (ribokinase family)
MSVAIIGTVAFDTVETPAGKREKVLGGSASFAGTAARLFSDVNLISIVGKDFPQEYRDLLSSLDIVTDGIQVSSGDTFHWEGHYHGDMSQAYTDATHLNVLLEFDPNVPESAKDAEIVFCANIDPTLQLKAIKQFRKPQLVVLDTMNFWIESKLDELKETLKHVDVLVINDQELRQLTGFSNIIEGMPHALELGPKRIIVKKGEHGAIMFNGTNYFICPAVPLNKLVDPTGAGDSFAGGICGYLAKYGISEDTFKQAVVVGTLISSHTVQDFSLDSLKALNFEQINRRYAEFKQYVTVPEALLI